ncbi:uncharacterized protein METZ01_LOCUS22925 [marine metagenome]|uniref:Uncharacterized protein n=1 Tax=marine metagenome TaxID=408172 RepID=A0A381PSQ2_9ZZZZ
MSSEDKEYGFLIFPGANDAYFNGSGSRYPQAAEGVWMEVLEYLLHHRQVRVHSLDHRSTDGAVDARGDSATHQDVHSARLIYVSFIRIIYQPPLYFI